MAPAAVLVQSISWDGEFLSVSTVWLSRNSASLSSPDGDDNAQSFKSLATNPGDETPIGLRRGFVVTGKVLRVTKS